MFQIVGNDVPKRRPRFGISTFINIWALFED